MEKSDITVYVLYSLNFERKYVGMTSSLNKRIAEQNTGKTKSTKAFMPWKVVYLEVYSSYSEARKREKYFKSGAGRRFLKEKLEWGEV